MISFVNNRISTNFEYKLKLTEQSRIRNAALANLLDLGFAFTVNHIALKKFHFGPLNQSLLSVAITQVSLVAVAVYTISKIIWDYKRKPTVWHSINQTFDGHAGQLPQLSLMLLANISYPFFIIHEYGHFFSALACFKQTRYPNVKIKPFFKGSTGFAISHGLTLFGEKLGQKWALTFVQAAGLGSSTVCAMTEFGLSSRIKEKTPILSHLLDLHGKVQIFHDVIYGLSAFKTSRFDNSHDLKAIWDNTGINPLIPVSIAVGLPLLQKYLLRC